MSNGPRSVALPVVAVFDSSPETADMLRMLLEHAGLTVVSAFTYDIHNGRVDLAAFMREHRPAAIIYDIAPPYDRNWQLLEHLRATAALKECDFVLTSTNAAYVQKLAGTDDRIYEVIGKPYDLHRIIEATNDAVHKRRRPPG